MAIYRIEVYKFKLTCDACGDGMPSFANGYHQEWVDSDQLYDFHSSVVADPNNPLASDICLESLVYDENEDWESVNVKFNGNVKSSNEIALADPPKIMCDNCVYRAEKNRMQPLLGDYED